MRKRHDNVVNESDLEWAEQGGGKDFFFRRKALAMAAGSRGLGLSLFELPPGKRAFPYHFHCANEEAMYVLDGEGTLRIGEKQVPIRAGDYVAFPPGPDHAHQVINSSDVPLRFLGISTMIQTEVCVYPDSDKIAALVGRREQRTISEVHRRGSKVDYYDAE